MDLATEMDLAGVERLSGAPAGGSLLSGRPPAGARKSPKDRGPARLLGIYPHDNIAIDLIYAASRFPSGEEYREAPEGPRTLVAFTSARSVLDRTGEG